MTTSAPPPDASADYAGSPARPSRRVVVVRDGQLAERIAGLGGVGLEVDCVPTFLAAMAHLATRGADALIGPADALGGIEHAGAEAFEQLGGRGRVVLLHHADDPALDGLREAGFGHFLENSADDVALAKALGVEVVNPPAVSQEALSAGALVLVGDPDHELGDLDLVEAMLHVASEGGDRVPRLAVAMAQQQSEIPGLAYVGGDRHEVPADRVSSRVSFQGKHYGHLHAPPPTTPDQLTPWAGWLARWIALDHQTRQLRDLAMRDELTGMWNRRYFNRFLNRILERAASDRQQVTLMVFDIDDFKLYNDRYGHAAGDEILKAAARLMQTVVRDHDVVARIGGDEFAVIFWDARGPRHTGSSHPDDVLNIAKRFQQAVCELRFPVLAQSDKDTLTISGGLAGFPWDGRTPEDLLHRADLMALESKRKGKNAITFGRGALRCELPPDKASD